MRVYMFCISNNNNNNIHNLYSALSSSLNNHPKALYTDVSKQCLKVCMNEIKSKIVRLVKGLPKKMGF